MEWKDAAIGLLSILSGVCVFILNLFRARIDVHEKKDDESFRELFESNRNQTALMTTGFKEVEKHVHDVHIDLLTKISNKRSGDK